jgi:cytochrome c peroxidase
MAGIRMNLGIAVLCLGLSMSAWAKEDTMARAKDLFKPLPAKATDIKGNPATPAKTDLGRMLYFEPRLSASYLISCNTCHNIGLGGADLQETSIGHGWQKGPRNAPTVFNAVYNVAQFWDGRAEDLKAQAKGPMEAPVEMHNTPDRVVEVLKSVPGYAQPFKNAFPGERDPITYDNVAKAIEVFEAGLLTPDAPFDRYLKGNRQALKPKEEAGLSLFINKGCAACHGGINVGGAGYFPFGVAEAPSAEIRPAADTGRFKVTYTSSDNYVFRAPSLRNVALTAPYFHSGKVWKLSEAVAVMGSAQLGIRLNDQETAAISVFLQTLTGKQPKIEYPILPPSSDSTPQPVIK